MPIADGRACHSSVEPSTSVSKNVTVPTGGWVATQRVLQMPEAAGPKHPLSMSSPESRPGRGRDPAVCDPFGDPDHEVLFPLCSDAIVGRLRRAKGDRCRRRVVATLVGS